MDSASIQFIAFGLLVALVSNFRRSAVWRSIVLAVASIVVLALLVGDLVSLVPLIAFVGLSYAGFALVNAGVVRRKAIVVVAVILAYAWLKKYTLLPEGSLLPFSYATIGLSYILFRALHVVIDAEVGAPRIPLGRYLLYTMNFTTIVSGPIQRYDDFAADQFAREPIALTDSDVAAQLLRLVVGFFKVAVLALAFDAIQKDALADLQLAASGLMKLRAAFLLALVYPFFLYCNFSGYIDVVLALARLMRVRLPENFDRPFSSTSFIEFWSRWHITLSNWLKIYVYNPLLITLMRRIESVTLEPFLGVLCFFVTFFLVGVWHGRTSEFVVFGILQGGGVAINKLWQIEMARRFGRKGYKAIRERPLYEVPARGLTFTWFAFTMFWFWGDWAQIGTIFSALTAPQWAGIWLALWIVMSVVLGLWEWGRPRIFAVRVGATPLMTHRYMLAMSAAALAFFGFVVSVLLNLPAPDIVYKAF